MAGSRLAAYPLPALGSFVAAAGIQADVD